MGQATNQPTYEQLLEQNKRLRKMNSVLMQRIEKSLSDKNSAYSLFETNILLKEKVYEKKMALENAYQKLRFKQEQLFEASKLSALGHMAGGVAHEINNPLTIILSLNRMIRKYLEKGEVQECFNILNKSDQTIMRIAKIVTALKMISTDTSNEEFAIHTVRSILEDTLNVTHERFKSRGIDVKVNLDNNCFGAKVKCNKVQLSQVFLNILNNAYDAVVSMKNPWVCLECQRENKKVKISFTDSGRGIGPEILDSIFEPFVTTKEIGQGIGIGMSISKRVILNHKGKIYLDKDSENTCFVIELPTVCDQLKSVDE